MKKFIMLVLIILMPFTAYGAETTGRVNHRTGASTGYSIIQKIPSGADVSIVYRYSKYWYKVVYNGRTGFIHSSYLSKGYSRSTLTYNGTAIPYYNNFSYQYMTNTFTATQAVQKRLDQGMAVMTGSQFSATDGRSNYVSGHADGIFAPLTGMGVGDVFTMRDKYNRATTYEVKQRIQSRNPATTAIGKSYVYAYYANGVMDESVLIQFCVGLDTVVLYATKK